MTVTNPSSTASGDSIANGLVATQPPELLTSVGAPSANLITAGRVTIPKAGTLHDLAVFIGTSSGNLRVGIYDCGVATPNVATRLYDSGSIAMPAAGWQIIGDPALAVTAGQQLDLVASIDNAVARIGQGFAGPNVGSMGTLPANFIPSSAAPKMYWTRDPGSFTLPATVTDGQKASMVVPPLLVIGRVA